MHVSSDGDESVCQGAGAALVVWLRGLEVVEHSLDVEAQQEAQEAARLAVLMETYRLFTVGWSKGPQTCFGSEQKW